MRLKTKKSCMGRPDSGAGEPSRRAEGGAAGLGLLHVPAAAGGAAAAASEQGGWALDAHARATSSAARSPACTCLRGGCSVPQLHSEQQYFPWGSGPQKVSIGLHIAWASFAFHSTRLDKWHPDVRASSS